MKSFGILTLTAASLAAVAIPGQQIGLNVALVWFAMTLAVWVAAREDLDGQDILLLALAVLPASLAVVRSAGWVIGLQLIAAVGSLSVAVARARGWVSIVRAPLVVMTQLHRGLVLALKPFPLQGWDKVRFTPALRTASLTFGLIALFGTLFLTADAAFAALAERWLVPDLDLTLVPARVTVFIGSLALVGALARLSPTVLEPTGSPWVFPDQRRYSLPSVDWKVALSGLNVLFALFVLVQLTVLFGGHRHVLETSGLTYAEYARQGFFQLIIVALLTLGVIAAVVAFGRSDKERAWIRGLLGPLCVMTLVILVSAAKRMDLYQEAYGFTRLRLLVDLFIIWLGGVFCLILAAGAFWRGDWLPRAIVTLSLIACIGFGLYNPDRRIAERNVARFEATGNVDLSYLSGLSTDALPALDGLREPLRGCVVQSVVSRVTPTRSLWSFNLSRRVATNFGGEVCRR